MTLLLCARVCVDAPPTDDRLAFRERNARGVPRHTHVVRIEEWRENWPGF